MYITEQHRKAEAHLESARSLTPDVLERLDLQSLQSKGLLPCSGNVIDCDVPLTYHDVQTTGVSGLQMLFDAVLWLTTLCEAVCRVQSSSCSTAQV